MTEMCVYYTAAGAEKMVVSSASPNSNTYAEKTKTDGVNTNHYHKHRYNYLFENTFRNTSMSALRIFPAKQKM